MKKWLFAVKRDNFSPSKSSFLCSKHFLDADFNYSSNLPHSESLMKRYLKKDAIPSVKWQNHKMKVNVATQLFSHSVAAAITFLRNIKLKGFENSKPTSDFILLMNDLFDVLNSKSKFGKHRKQPINSNNFNDIQTILCDTVAFLKSLKDTNDLPLIQGPQKTFLIGFCVSSHSILTISKNLLEREESPFEYILTYRFSQDAIEMFFSKIRSRFGWNNNPTALQFKYALRSLLLKNKIESPSIANCVLLSDQ